MQLDLKEIIQVTSEYQLKIAELRIENEKLKREIAILKQEKRPSS